MQREDHQRGMGSSANKLQTVGCAVLGLLAVVVVLVVGLAPRALGDGGESAAGSGGGSGVQRCCRYRGLREEARIRGSGERTRATDGFVVG